MIKLDKYYRFISGRWIVKIISRFGYDSFNFHKLDLEIGEAEKSSGNIFVDDIDINYKISSIHLIRLKLKCIFMKIDSIYKIIKF
jgi:hypothetical protein